MYNPNQKNIQSFLTVQNVTMLLEIIMDDNLMKIQSHDVIDATKFVFHNNIRGFYENEKSNAHDLVDLNKQYIILILRHVKNVLFVKSNQHVTFEDIRNDRRSQFDRDLNARQSEFTNAITPPVPPVPKFCDDAQDESSIEMGYAIQQMTEQRNYDVEQIAHNTNKFSPIPPPTQNSSFNNEKFIRPIVNHGNNQTQGGVRYIKIDTSEAQMDDNLIVDLTKRENESSFEKNIFSKLKKVDEITILQSEMRELRATVDAMAEDIKKLLQSK
jgi:hypothetical protein